MRGYSPSRSLHLSIGWCLGTGVTLPVTSRSYRLSPTICTPLRWNLLLFETSLEVIRKAVSSVCVYIGILVTKHSTLIGGCVCFRGDSIQFTVLLWYAFVTCVRWEQVAQSLYISVPVVVSYIKACIRISSSYNMMFRWLGRQLHYTRHL
jgi:hypothetical protein